MSTKHSPVPWRDDKAEHDEPYLSVKIRSGTRTVCVVNIDDVPDREYNAEQYANANFIVRAVNSHDELLAALRECLTIVRIQNGNLHADTNEIRARAESAIAKATGGT